MKYEYLVRTQGQSVMDDLETLAKGLDKMLNLGEVDAHVELGWELWATHVLSDGSGGNNGFMFIYRRPKR